MKKQFTPGPWCVYFGGSEVIEILDYTEELRVISWSGFDSNDTPKEENRANANLISCAPEMYEMLEKIANSTVHDKDYATAKPIFDLLAKARGEEC